MKFIFKLAGIATGAFLGTYIYEKVVHQDKKEKDVEEEKPREDIEFDVEDINTADSLKEMTDEDISSLGV